MDIDTSTCTSLAKTQIGEARSSDVLEHKVSEAVTKQIVLEAVDSNLCGSHAAVAMLVVDGKVAAAGDVSTKGSALQAKVGKGQTVRAFIHLVDAATDIQCVTLGNSSIILLDCGVAT